MALADIAADIEVTAEQRERGVAVVDRTDADLGERLAPFASELPCAPGAAATLVEAYAAGRSVGDAARAAGLAPVTGAKTLHLLGEPIAPLGPTGREVVRDWLAAELSRSTAVELAGASETEFALAAYVETHDPIPGAVEAVASALDLDGDAAVAKREHLGETMSGVDELF
ncbi:MAG: hypothetical protein ABEJ23_01870 [Haloarculaceae archaeon]